MGAADFRHSGASTTYQLHYGPQVHRDAARTPASVRARRRLARSDPDGSRTGKQFTVDLAATRVEEQGRWGLASMGSKQLKDGDVSRGSPMKCAHSYPGTPWVRVLFTTPRLSGKRVPDTAQPEVGRAREDGAEWLVHQHTDESLRKASYGRRGSAGLAPLGALFVRDFWQNYPLVSGGGTTGRGVHGCSRR